MTIQQALDILVAHDTAVCEENEDYMEELTPQLEEALNEIAEVTGIPDWFLAERTVEYTTETTLPELQQEWLDWNDQKESAEMWREEV